MGRRELRNKSKDKKNADHQEKDRQYNSSVNNLYPKFSLEFNTASGRKISDIKDKKDRVLVLDKFVYLNTLTWKDIKKLPREQGFEKIPFSQLKKAGNKPHRFKDETDVVVFRMPSAKGRLIGFIDSEVFYLVWVDTKFDMYNH
ncbi:hypothetical protein PQO01_03465 [Lentisphaera marina]|uniref:hypothetical protein n=1 Tax=Lentisphaera marina TaxID=1111041 RepID=UPI00236740AF|nr:hypothetical protein [Lentisphaera marina]MDD7984009.1 hypothetical protein [Lentisphaera marina]